MTDPTHCDAGDVVRPNRQQPDGPELDAGESQVSDRTVAPYAPVMRADTVLDRLSPDRIAEIRGRLESGAYSSFEVMTELAVRMLESGDLE